MLSEALNEVKSHNSRKYLTVPRHLALSRLKDEAKNLGANAVIRNPKVLSCHSWGAQEMLMIGTQPQAIPPPLVFQ